MKHDYKVQTVLERGDERSTWKGRGWVGVGSNPGRIFFFFFFFFFFFLLTQKCRDCTFGYVWACYFCLQTLLWPWKVHRPSSWSLLLSELALKLKVFFSLNGFFWVVLNRLSTNELKKKSWVFLGFDPGASESGVRRSTNWATRAKLTGQ